MTKAHTLDLVSEALEVKRKIEVIEAGELAELNSLMKTYKQKLERLMGESDDKEHETALGKVIRIVKHTKGKLDEEKIAVDLGCDDLEKYRGEGKDSPYVKLSLTK